MTQRAYHCTPAGLAVPVGPVFFGLLRFTITSAQIGADGLMSVTSPASEINPADNTSPIDITVTDA